MVILTATRTIFSDFSGPLSLRTWNHFKKLIKHHNYERTDSKPWMISELQSVVYFSNEFEFKKEKKNNYNKLWILFSVNTSIKNKTILFLIYIIIFNSSSDEALLPCYIQNQNQDEVIHVPSNNAFCFPCLIMYSPACLATTIQNDRKKTASKIPSH